MFLVQDKVECWGRYRSRVGFLGSSGFKRNACPFPQKGSKLSIKKQQRFKPYNWSFLGGLEGQGEPWEEPRGWAAPQEDEPPFRRFLESPGVPWDRHGTSSVVTCQLCHGLTSAVPSCQEEAWADVLQGMKDVGSIPG